MKKSTDTYGRRDEKGHWKPSSPPQYAPIAHPPFRVSLLLKWLFGWGGYLWPRHIGYGALAFITWRFLQADLSTSQTLSISWIWPMLVRNYALTLLVYGFYHITLYVWKVMGDKGKYHPKGQEKGRKKYLFRDQVKDNMFYVLVSGVPIWTAWEVLYLWLASNGRMPLITWASHPVWFVAQFSLIPIWRDIHFYWAHKFLHWKPMFRAVHLLHHRNPNPGPWSGMSMHPIEHILYLSVVLIHFIVPSHPMHVFFTLQHAALIPAHTHTGYEGRMFGFWPIGDYFHYLHHKHVACNFGSTLIPFDTWFGRFYDGEGLFRIKEPKTS